MKIFKILLYILAIPLFVYIALFLNYLSAFSLVLIFAIFFFRDLKMLNLWWFLAITSVFLDIVLHFWLGTHFLSITFILLLLLLFDRFVGNVFLDIIAVFFSFILFKIFFQIFIFFQETSAFVSIDSEFLLNAIFFAVKNIFIYLILKSLGYIFSSYFRDNLM